MLGEKFYQPLAHETRRAQYACTPFFRGTGWQGTPRMLGHAALIAVVRRMRAHAAPPNCPRSLAS